MPRKQTRARAIAREMGEAEKQAKAVAKGCARLERIERALKRAGVEFYQNVCVNKGTWMWRHRPSNFKGGPFNTEFEAVAHAHADLGGAGIIDW